MKVTSILILESNFGSRSPFGIEVETLQEKIQYNLNYMWNACVKSAIKCSWPLLLSLRKSELSRACYNYYLIVGEWQHLETAQCWTEVFQWRTHNSHFVLVSRKKRLLLEPKKTVTKISKEKRKHKNPNKQGKHFTRTHLWKNIKIFFHPEK